MLSALVDILVMILELHNSTNRQPLVEDHLASVYVQLYALFVSVINFTHFKAQLLSVLECSGEHLSYSSVREQSDDYLLMSTVRIT